MDQIIETYDRPVLLIGGGAVDWALFEKAAAGGFAVIAADGGANGLRPRGFTPDLIIGDIDSLEDRAWWEARCRVLEIADQNTTDLEKCLLAIDAPLYVAFGFLGGRLDHSLAAVNLMARFAGKKRLVLVDTEDLIFAPGGELELALPIDSRISVLPLSPVTFTHSSGLEYPLDGLDMTPGGAVGVSNRVVASPIQIAPEASGSAAYAVVLENIYLDAVLAWWRSI